jgi:hypothetical protein
MPSHKHELDSLRYVAESAAEQLRVAEEREHWTQYSDGACTSFYSCRICGASVQPMDCETHIEWHRTPSPAQVY